MRGQGVGDVFRLDALYLSTRRSSWRCLPTVASTNPFFWHANAHGRALLRIPARRRASSGIDHLLLGHRERREVLRHFMGMHTVHAAEPKVDAAVARGERLAQRLCS